jgi:3-dehydroquinate synthase
MKALPDLLDTGSHHIYCGGYAFESLALRIGQLKPSSIFILVDENSAQHCLPSLLSDIDALTEAEIIEIESGESQKTVETCIELWRVLGELGADRKSLLLNVGGGVITDLGAFVASTFKRGISYINVPTTLLAQVDASIGGKTGFDLGVLKNEIGTFSQPDSVFIVPDFLRTLPGRQLLSGYAECLKHALIADHEYWNVLSDVNIADPKNWEAVIFRSLEIKLQIVREDPLESGIRKVLNFGHTVGHALESYYLEDPQRSLLHGEAVIVGMICEAWLSVEKGLLSARQFNEIVTQLIALYGVLELPSGCEDRIVELMRGDKKNEKGAFRFTLLTKIGEAVYNKAMTPEDVLAAISFYRTLKVK